MSDIKSKLDEHGVPMCNCDNCGKADECDEAWHGRFCYPKMVEIVAAATAVVGVHYRLSPRYKSTMEPSMSDLREALK